jgi:hypothetical protein
MFSFLKKKSKLEILHENYKKLQQEAFRLSTTSRVQSDQKYAEAQEVLKQIEAIEKTGE